MVLIVCFLLSKFSYSPTLYLFCVLSFPLEGDLILFSLISYLLVFVFKESARALALSIKTNTIRYEIWENSSHPLYHQLVAMGVWLVASSTIVVLLGPVLVEPKISSHPYILIFRLLVMALFPALYFSKIMFCFIILVFLLLLYNYNSGSIIRNIHPLHEIPFEYKFFSAVSDNSGTVTVLLFAQRSIKVGWN